MPHDKTNWPDWLKEAEISDDAIVEVTDDGKVIWEGGTWYSGTWECGIWEYGLWKDGLWKDGTWKDGTWNGGVWEYGIWKGGTWKDGTWKDGVWKCGVWRGGIWEDGIWDNGTWHDGIWNGGVCYFGVWYGGIWKGGTWYYGTWHNGVWNDGAWHDGVWNGGIWYGGVWMGGLWKGGTWKAKQNRLLYMASLIGIVFDPTTQTATAYRTTNSNGRGKFNKHFIQPEGEFYEDDLPPAGSGTCVKGIHVTTMKLAWDCFGEDPTDQLWKVTFHKKDLLDCDGQKARIRGGIFEKIDHQF